MNNGWQTDNLSSDVIQKPPSPLSQSNTMTVSTTHLNTFSNKNNIYNHVDKQNIENGDNDACNNNESVIKLTCKPIVIDNIINTTKILSIDENEVKEEKPEYIQASGDLKIYHELSMTTEELAKGFESAFQWDEMEIGRNQKGKIEAYIYFQNNWEKMMELLFRK